MERTGNVFTWCDVCGSDNDHELVVCNVYEDEFSIRWNLCAECEEAMLEVDKDEV